MNLEKTLIQNAKTKKMTLERSNIKEVLIKRTEEN